MSFKRITRDHWNNNARTTTNQRIPIYSNDPPVFVNGQIYYNSTNETLCYSVDVNKWKCIGNGFTYRQ